MYVTCHRSIILNEPLQNEVNFGDRLFLLSVAQEYKHILRHSFRTFTMFTTTTFSLISLFRPNAVSVLFVLLNVHFSFFLTFSKSIY